MLSSIVSTACSVFCTSGETFECRQVFGASDLYSAFKRAVMAASIQVVRLAPLGIIAAVASGCGSVGPAFVGAGSPTSAPKHKAGGLNTEFAGVGRQMARADCATAQNTSLPRIEYQVASLPASVPSDVRLALADSAAHLRSAVDGRCHRLAIEKQTAAKAMRSKGPTTTARVSPHSSASTSSARALSHADAGGKENRSNARDVSSLWSRQIDTESAQRTLDVPSSKLQRFAGGLKLAGSSRGVPVLMTVVVEPRIARGLGAGVLDGEGNLSANTPVAKLKTGRAHGLSLGGLTGARLQLSAASANHTAKGLLSGSGLSKAGGVVQAPLSKAGTQVPLHIGVGLPAAPAIPHGLSIPLVAPSKSQQHTTASSGSPVGLGSNQGNQLLGSSRDQNKPTGPAAPVASTLKTALSGTQSSQNTKTAPANQPQSQARGAPQQSSGSPAPTSALGSALHSAPSSSSTAGTLP